MMISSNLIERLVSMNSIPRNVASMLVVKEVSADDNFIKVNFEDEGSADSHPELSELRGATFDRRTGAKVCGGSTYTRIAVANSLNLVGDEIPINLENGELVTVNYQQSLSEGQEEGNNIAIPSSKAFIRPYMEGTVIMITKSNNTVFVQNHSHLEIRQYSSDQTRMGSYQGVNFWAAALEASDINPDIFFPAECSDSPYCFRFLVVTPKLMKGSRVYIGSRGCLTFLGVQMMWNHDSEDVPGPYAYSRSDKVELSRRPFVEHPDMRTREELLDLETYFRVPIIYDLDDDSRPLDKFVYYPRMGFDLEKANDFILNGPHYGEDHSLENAANLELHQGLGVGDAVILTHEINVKGKIYYESVKIMSESCRHRIDLQGDRMPFNGLLEFIDSPGIDQPLKYVNSSSATTMYDAILETKYPFFHPPLAPEPQTLHNPIARQYASANYFIFCCTPSLHEPLMRRWKDFVTDRNSLSTWVLTFDDNDSRLILMPQIKEHIHSLLSLLRHTLTDMNSVIASSIISGKVIRANSLIMAMKYEEESSLSKPLNLVGKIYETKEQKSTREAAKRGRGRATSTPGSGGNPSRGRGNTPGSGGSPSRGRGNPSRGSKFPSRTFT